VGDLKEPDDSASYLPSMRGSMLGENTPSSLVPWEYESPTRPQVASSLSYVAEGNDLFDTNSPGWTFEGHLAASLQSEDETRKRSLSAEMSILFDNLRVIGAGSGATY